MLDLSRLWAPFSYFLCYSTCFLRLTSSLSWLSTAAASCLLICVIYVSNFSTRPDFRARLTVISVSACLDRPNSALSACNSSWCLYSFWINSSLNLLFSFSFPRWVVLSSKICASRSWILALCWVSSWCWILLKCGGSHCFCNLANS